MSDSAENGQSSIISTDMEKEAVQPHMIECASDGNISPDTSAQGTPSPAAVGKASGADHGARGPKGHGGHGAGGKFPPGHPMHPSKFVGDKFEMKAVLTLAGCFCVMFSTFGWINCVGVFQDYYSTHQLKSYSASTVSWIISCELFFMFLGGPFVGKLYDNFGPKYLLLVGTCLHVFGLMMASLSTEYYQFLLSQGVCSPIGASMLFFPAMTTLISWFLRRRALAFGVMTAGGSLGGVVFPIMVAQLTPKVGFAWTMRICAFLILGLLIIANLTIRSRLPPRKAPVSFAEFFSPLKERPYLLLNIGSFCGYLGLFVPISYVVVQASSIGMPVHLQGYLIPILNGASLFGRVIPGFVADLIGRFNIMISICSLSIIFIFAIWMPATTNAITIAFAALYGFASGAYVSIMPTLVAEITTDMSKLGVRNGTSFAIISIAVLIGSPISGALITANDGKFYGLQAFAGGTLAVGTLVIFATRQTLVGSKLLVKV